MTSQQWPFADAGEEFRALLAKMTSEQRQAMRARIEGGKIFGTTSNGALLDCGCVYGTFEKITHNNWILVADLWGYVSELWGSHPEDNLTPLEYMVLNITPGQTPADNPASRWLVDMMTAFESEQS